jgi:hypothetical protein
MRIMKFTSSRPGVGRVFGCFLALSIFSIAAQKNPVAAQSAAAQPQRSPPQLNAKDAQVQEKPADWSDRLYAGAGLGLADYKGAFEGVSYNDRPFSLQAFGGYRISDRWSMELAYARSDDIESGEIAGSGVERLDIDAQLETKIVRALLTLPLSEALGWQKNVRVFGTIGYHDSESRSEIAELGSGEKRTDRQNDSGLAFGGGILYGIGKIDLRGYVEWLDRDTVDDAWSGGVAVEYGF